MYLIWIEFIGKCFFAPLRSSSQWEIDIFNMTNSAGFCDDQPNLITTNLTGISLVLVQM